MTRLTQQCQTGNGSASIALKRSIKKMLLPIHIIAGLIGLATGAVALYAAKGAKLHRKSGMIFVYTMLVVPSPAP